MGLYSGGLIIGRIFESAIWGGGAYFREALFFFGGGGGSYYRNFTVVRLCLGRLHEKCYQFDVSN